jgi:KUP system potassium uptake protein
MAFQPARQAGLGTQSEEKPKALAPLAVGALGIVYGDIGTSPLYALHVTFGDGKLFTITQENVFGILSLIAWSLMIVVTLKYVVLIMRADNRGEGGILALYALLRRLLRVQPSLRKPVMVAALAGLALFFGDSTITPAISVLSAVEGLEIATPAFRRFVVPISLAVLVGLFVIQRHGTRRVGQLFGPIMAIWFVSLAAMGVAHIQDQPAVLSAFHPKYAIAFVEAHGIGVLVAFGAVVLAVTGAEALYADMGHFGRKPIRLAWISVVFPGLLLHYMGQGAFLLSDPNAIRNPFFLMVPAYLLYPLVALATIATVIASQAVISGAFSMVHQGIQLGLIPRLEVLYTSSVERGQIYVPKANWWLLAAVIFLVVWFQKSSNLAAAYGIAVTGTMMIDTVLASLIALLMWRWPMPIVLLLFGFLLTVDLLFFASTSLKLADGGWAPLVLAGTLLALMLTWVRGREILYRRLEEQGMGLASFLKAIEERPVKRVPGTAVYLARIGENVPHALLHNLKHNKIIHERVVLLTVKTEDDPYVAPQDRVEVAELSQGFHRAVIHYGFRETPDIPRDSVALARAGLALKLEDSSYFVGRVTLVRADRPTLPRWQRRLFFIVTRNAYSAPDFYKLPPNRVVEMGAQLAI